MKRFSIALLLLLVAASLVAQPAQPPRPGVVVLVKYLELTPDQIASWKQIRTETATTVQPLAQQARELAKQLETALSAATPDPTAVGKLAISLHATREQIKAARDAADGKLRATLTADQKTKFDAFQAAAKALRAGRRR